MTLECDLLKRFDIKTDCCGSCVWEMEDGYEACYVVSDTGEDVEVCCIHAHDLRPLLEKEMKICTNTKA